MSELGMDEEIGGVDEGVLRWWSKMWSQLLKGRKSYGIHAC